MDKGKINREENPANEFFTGETVETSHHPNSEAGRALSGTVETQPSNVGEEVVDGSKPLPVSEVATDNVDANQADPKAAMQAVLDAIQGNRKVSPYEEVNRLLGL